MKLHHVGETTITRVTEQSGLGFPPEVLYAEWNPSVLERYRDLLIPTCFDEIHSRFKSSIHTWVIKTSKHVILIDSCGGNNKNRPTEAPFHQQNYPYLVRLAEAGVTPEQVDFVCCTHLHLDHCGWNTQLRDGRWVPTFPNAKYVFSKTEHDFWCGLAGESGFNAGVYEDSVLPVVASGQAFMVDGGASVGDNLMVHATPGHSPGHITLELASKGRRGLFSGDIMHQPLQVFQPDWNSAFCYDQPLARKSRRWLLDRAAEEQATVFTAHFPDSSAGLVTRRGDGFDWRFV